MARRMKLDMTGVESYTRCPEGEWLAKLSSIEEGTVQGSGDDCLKARFEVIKGSAKGCAVFETFSLTEKALWKLKGFLEAVGMKSNGKISIDLDKLEGKVCIIDVVHDEYNGTKRAKISQYINPEDDDDEAVEDDEEEEATRKPTKKAPTKPVKKSEPMEDDEDEDEDEDEEDPKAKKPVKKASPAKKAPAKTKKKVEEDEDDDDDWEDDDD